MENVHHNSNEHHQKTEADRQETNKTKQNASYDTIWGHGHGQRTGTGTWDTGTGD